MKSEISAGMKRFFEVNKYEKSALMIACNKRMGYN